MTAMAENVLFNAQMNPAVKTYWLINLLLISTVTVVGIPLLVLSIPIFFLCAGRVLASISATLTERKLIVKPVSYTHLTLPTIYSV